MSMKKGKHTGWTYEWTDRREKGRVNGRKTVGTGEAEENIEGNNKNRRWEEERKKTG